MRTWLLFILYFISVAAFGHGEQSVNTTNSDALSKAYALSKLQSFLIKDAPEESGVYLFFDRGEDPKYRKVLEDLISENPSLLALSESGRKFLESYKKLLAEDFGAENVTFALAPEDEILRRSRVTDYSQRKYREEVQRDPREAERLALRDTLATYPSLPRNYQFRDIERGRYVAKNGEAIYNYYQRLYGRYLIWTEEQMKPDRDGVRKFKEQMIDKLEHLKAQNFLNFLRRVKTYTQEYELIINANKYYSLSSRKIKSIDLDFSNDEFLAINEKIESVKVKQSIWKKIIQWRGKKWEKKDFANTRNVYSVPWIDPNITKKSVSLKITLIDGHVINLDINEGDFSNWINSVKPASYFGDAKDDHTHRQYVIETASRNAVFTNLISYLSESRARTLEELQTNLEYRILRVKAEEYLDKQTLTEQFRVQSNKLKIESKFFSTIWAGFAVHPDYWSIRDAAAKDVESVSRRSQLDQAKKFKEQELFKKNFRYKSPEERAHFSNKIFLRNFFAAAGVAGAAAGIVIGLSNFDSVVAPFEWTWNKVKSIEMPNVQLPDMPEISLPDIGLPKLFEFSLNGNLDYFQMLKIQESKNVKIYNGNRNKGHDFGFEIPNLTSAEKKKSIVYFVSPKRIQLHKVPRVYDVLSKDNLPQEILDDKSFDRETEPATRLFVSGNYKADFSVITNLPHKPMNARVPIAVPDGSQIIGLQVRSKNKQILEEGVDYKLYKLKSNHLLWIELSEKYKTTNVGYSADYVLNSQSSVKSPVMVNWEADALRAVNEKLNKAGITKLATALNKEVAWSQTVPVEQIEMTFVGNATYTYSTKMWQVRGNDKKNPFRPSTKYLNESDDLNYQCTGSNELFKIYANVYYKVAGIDSMYKAENITAFAMKKPSHIITVNGGHMRTVLFNKMVFSDYKIVDATPPGTGNDPDDDTLTESNEEKSGSSPEKPIEVEQYWIRAEGPKIPKPTEKIVEGPETEEKSEEKSEEKIEETTKVLVPEKLTIDEEQELLLRKVKELVILRGKFKRWIKNLVYDDPEAHNDFAKSETPGLQIYAFSRLVEDFVLGRINEGQFLAQYLSISWLMPQPRYLEQGYLRSAQHKIQELKKEGHTSNQIISSITVKIEADFKNQIQFVQKSLTNGQAFEADFVLDVEYQNLLKKMARFISTTKWGQLNPKYLEKYKSCEHLVTGGATYGKN